MIMPRPPYDVIETTTTGTKSVMRPVDAENVVRNLSLRRRDLEVWMITTGHDHMPMHLH